MRVKLKTRLKTFDRLHKLANPSRANGNDRIVDKRVLFALLEDHSAMVAALQELGVRAVPDGEDEFGKREAIPARVRTRGGR